MHLETMRNMEHCCPMNEVMIKERLGNLDFFSLFLYSDFLRLAGIYFDFT